MPGALPWAAAAPLGTAVLRPSCPAAGAVVGSAGPGPRGGGDGLAAQVMGTMSLEQPKGPHPTPLSAQRQPQRRQVTRALAPSFVVAPSGGTSPPASPELSQQTRALSFLPDLEADPGPEPVPRPPMHPLSSIPTAHLILTLSTYCIQGFNKRLMHFYFHLHR